MSDFYYHPYDIARVLSERNIGCIEEDAFLQSIWEIDRAFLAPVYRKDKRKFLYECLDCLHYLYDKETYDKEFPEIQRELLAIGSETSIDEIFYDVNIGFFFKRMRLQLMHKEKACIRLKLRSLLSSYGYERRSKNIMRYLEQCLCFYHIQVYRKGKVQCDLAEIDLDDMIIFRLM